jgi:hypothetical protein
LERVRNPIFSADPRGRCDVAVVRIGELLVRNRLEPACGGVKLWDNGLDELTAAYVEALGVPATPLSLADLFRYAGLLPNPRRGVR